LTKQELTHLKRLKNGDLESFNWLYRQYHERVYFFCYKLTSDQEVAEEITEDVFVKLWYRREVIDPAMGIQGLLFKMARDFVWSHLRKSSNVNRLREQFILESLPGAYNPIESNLILQEYLEIAEKGIEMLPERCRKTFLLHYKNGMNNREIAHKLRITEITVRVHLSNAAKFLRNYLKSHPEIPLQIFLLLLA